MFAVYIYNNVEINGFISGSTVGQYETLNEAKHEVAMSGIVGDVYANIYENGKLLLTGCRKYQHDVISWS
jgi:hypothetical protein